jgi:hypothetical protein
MQKWLDFVPEKKQIRGIKLWTACVTGSRDSVRVEG